MRIVPCMVALALMGSLSLRAATIPLYENLGVMNDFPSPQIDATAVVNHGTFIVQPIYLPYDFQNTLYLTNHGTMIGAPGFQLDYVSGTTGLRKPMSSIVNHVNATMEGFPLGLGGFVTVNNSAFLLLSATNIQNRGLMTVGPEGMVRLQGQTVDLQRSAINVDLVGGGGGFGDLVISNGFFPDVGIFDNYWGGPANDQLDLATFYELDTNVGAIVVTPFYGATNQNGAGFDAIGLVGPAWGVYTNVVDETNTVAQAAFVGYNTNLVANRIRFSPVSSLNDFMVIAVELSMTRSNAVTGLTSTESLYITDDLGANTNWAILMNFDTGVTFRPGNYRVGRVPYIDNLFGNVGNGQLTTNLFLDASYSNASPDVLYTAYSPYVVQLGPYVPQVDGFTVSNLTGRFEVDAKTLDLELTQARANGLMSIRTDHLISSENAILQSDNFMFDLASTNGTLRMTQMIAPGGNRFFEGPIFMYSALWTNTSDILTTNIDDTGTNIVTNVVNHGFHVLVMDATSLGYTQDSLTHGLTLRSTNVLIDDEVVLAGKLLLDAETVTLNGALYFSGGDGNVGATNFPRLQNFENFGRFQVGANANFTDGFARSVQNFVNHSNITAAGFTARSRYFQNSGVLDSSGLLRLDAGIAKFEGGRMRAQSDCELKVGDLKQHRYTNTVNGSLFLEVTNSLSDSGGGALCQWTCSQGFFMHRKPTYGDLLGTRIQSAASARSVVSHVWPADDRGVSVRGFQDNVAIGRLVLSSGQNGLLRFHAPDTAGNYAIYVDYLELQGFVLNAYRRGRLEQYLELAPNVTIYYAMANVPVEELDGALGGHFRWVKDFAGPNSSIEVALPSGKTIRVNRGLRESVRIDSDGDGLANGYDPVPFSEPVVQAVVERSASRALVRWMAAPLTTYTVEYSSDLGGGDWQPLATVTNREWTVRSVEVEDVLEENQARYYRVRYNP